VISCTCCCSSFSRPWSFGCPRRSDIDDDRKHRPRPPIDLLTATGRYDGPFGWNVDRPTPAADQWLESKFPLWSRSILEDWAAGAFDGLELVVFSRADDAAQRLYYYVCELQRSGAIRGPEAFLLDVAKVPRASSEDHMIAAVRALAERLGVADEAAEAGIAVTNERRQTLPETPAGRACLLAGTPPPDRRLHAVIEASGYVAIGPTLADNWGDLGPSVEEGTGDPLAAIARQLHTRPDDQRGFDDHPGSIADRARATSAQAAVLWYTEEDEARVWTLPPVRRALAADGLPACVLTRRDWAAQDGAGEEIRDFLMGLNS
jgi:hypothetical protein